MRRLLVATGISVVLVAVGIVAFGGGDDASSALPRDPMTGKTEFDIPVQDPVLVAEGAAIYQASCASCHGADLRGTAVGPSHLSIIYNPDHHGDRAFASAVVNGVEAHHWNFGDMPPVAGISEADFVRLIAFIRERQRLDGFEAYPPP